MKNQGWRNRPAFLTRLSSRERRVVVVGTILSVLIGVYFLWLEPTLSRTRKLDRLIPQKEAQAAAFAVQQELYLSLSQKILQAERRMHGARSPLVFVEEIAAQNRLREKIVSIRPLPTQTRLSYQEVSAEVKIEQVRFAEALPFLRALELAPAKIQRLAIKSRFSDSSLLDITFVVSSYSNNE